MKISDLASRPNLELAWRRITTGGNQQYKRLYRELYQAYEIALEKNLADLRQRLIGGSFTPRSPERIYVPKATGLHRPLGLLGIEDQIVLQAFANLAARRMQPRRQPFQFSVVFSNILTSPTSIFFFRQWQRTYAAFQARIREHYEAGLRWVGDFDLAAFYDTVSHHLLVRTIYPKTTTTDLAWLEGCLKVWSSDHATSGHGHGLPQGPITSDFLAECFLFPIDRALKSRRGYVRYVDDVRLFGATESEVRVALIELERHCRERGLIPQVGKFAIKKAASIRDAMGMLPSIADPQHESGEKGLPREKARRLFLSALGHRPLRVVDKTRMRFVLYRGEPDSRLLKVILRLIARHPEHADAFFVYLGRCGYRRPVERLCLDLVAGNPYPYVRGEAWHVLARCLRERGFRAIGKPGALSAIAIEIARGRLQESFMERWGACHYLCASEAITNRHHSRFVNYQAPLLQAVLARALPRAAYKKGEAVVALLRRSAPEPGLAICAGIHGNRLTLDVLGLKAADVRSQVANTLRELGVIEVEGPRVDVIAEVLAKRYGIPRGKSWARLLGDEYVHALGLLKQAEAAFAGNSSYWLACQNSFNQTIFMALQRHLASISHPGACTIINKKGELVDFGVTLDKAGPFSTHCQDVASGLREVNERRNRLPASHPYAKKSIAQARYLRTQERNRFVGILRVSYAAFTVLMP